MNDRELRRRLACWLEGQGAIWGVEWRTAFEEVPRHVFVPEGEFWFGNGRQRVRLSRDEDQDEWLGAVYRDVSIVIRDDQRGCSSSSMPAVMGKMLTWLVVEDGNSVLEIGTGTGYNAGLLCHRLGADRVTSIDVQADLVQAARERLRMLGWEPHLAVADGTQGYLSRAPYDRVIGTCCVWPIPTAWIEQTRPDGCVTAVVPGGVVRLVRAEDGSASGPFHPHEFAFMPMLGYMPDESGEPADDLEGRRRAWRYPADLLYAGGWEQSSFWVLLLSVMRYPRRRNEAFIDLGDRSWVRFDQASGEVVQGGPRSLWDEVEALYEQWCVLGAPNRERFGLTVHPDGSHVLWLDDEKRGHRWKVSL